MGGGGGVAEAKYTFRFVLRWAYHREVEGVYLETLKSQDTVCIVVDCTGLGKC